MNSGGTEKTELAMHFARFPTYFDMDDLIGDYEVTTVAGLINGRWEYSKGLKINLEQTRFEVIDMDGVKIDKKVLQI
jgi:putative hemolysin